MDELVQGVSQGSHGDPHGTVCGFIRDGSDTPLERDMRVVQYTIARSEETPMHHLVAVSFVLVDVEHAEVVSSVPLPRDTW